MSTDQIIICLIIEEGRDILDSDNLIRVADHHGLVELKEILEREKLPAMRVVSHVPVRQLLERERRAQKTKFPPLHSLTHFWRLDASSVDDSGAFANQLGRLSSEISLSYVEARAGPTSIPAPPANYQSDQLYLDPAPVGVDAYWAWNQPNGKGEDVRVIDLESGWILTHTDLPKPQLLFNDNVTNQNEVRDHGAAVMGIIAAKDNGVGVTGIAPNLASLNAVSHYEQASDTDYHVSDAIAVAMNCLRAGDILLLEVARYPDNGSISYPTEYDAADHTAIRSAVAAGIVVIEAAGNSHRNLNVDLPIAEDSGAIMVGAGWSAVSGSPSGHRREHDSNFGDRVDCYAWGDSIATAGYGDKAGLLGGDTSYTGLFKRTSWVKARCVNPLDSEHMRIVLSDPSTGTPQSSIATSSPDLIGVMPDLRKILGWRLWIRVVWWCLKRRIRRAVAIISLPFNKSEYQN
jgi:hypothetical protein